MGILDLQCVATGLPIVGGKDPRCVFFFLVGEGPRAVPISLPVQGVWNGAYPELDAGWHATALVGGLESLAKQGRRVTSAKWEPGVLLDLVAGVLSGARPVTTPAGEPLSFAVALEDFYAVLASEDPAEERPDAALPIHALLLSAVPRTDLLEQVYAGAPEAELRRGCLDFRRFRRWFEASRS